jgi:hypothetical protein
MITRVRNLTRMNTIALDNVMICTQVGTTFAEFEGSPVQALAKVTTAMSKRGADSTYHSLLAVRRKLVDAANNWDGNLDGQTLAMTRHVTVTR